MDTCSGLTIVPHDELERAVNNHIKAKKAYDELWEGAANYAHSAWKEIPLYKRFYYKFKAGIFRPEEWWIAYGKYLKDNRPEGLYKVRTYCSVWHNTQVAAARSCKHHATCTGVHYLNDEQVLFVSVFKDLGVK